MLISDKQRDANRRNAQLSTGPKTEEGKAAVRFNALTWGLRARCLMLDHDDAKDYQMLWDALEAELHPQTATERHYIEQMCVAEWLLVRVSETERHVLDAGYPCAQRIALIDRLDARRARLERSYTTALREIERLKKQRDAQASGTTVETKPAAAPAQPPESPEPPEPPRPYVMSNHSQPVTSRIWGASPSGDT